MWCPFAVQTFTRNDQFRSHTHANGAKLFEIYPSIESEVTS